MRRKEGQGVKMTIDVVPHTALCLNVRTEDLVAACVASVVLISEAASVGFRGASSGLPDYTDRLAEREEHVTVVKAVPAPRRARTSGQSRRDHLCKSVLSQSTRW